MKIAIAKAVVVFTLVLSLLFMGMTAVNTANSGIAVCHDGPIHGNVVY